MLAAVHGVFERSISTLTTPRLVLNVTTWKPLVGGLVAGRAGNAFVGAGEADVEGPVVGRWSPSESLQVQPVGGGEVVCGASPPMAATTIQIPTPSTSRRATPPPMRACMSF